MLQWWQNFWLGGYAHARHLHPNRSARPSFQHFSFYREENGRTGCHGYCVIVCQSYFFISPRIQIIKFSSFCTYEQSSVGFKVVSGANILFPKILIPSALHKLQISFMNVKPRTILERSRCFLVVFSASFGKVLVKKLVVPR